jgi:hypothetical protein
MVTALLPQVLPVVLHGLQQWTVSLRCAAARCDCGAMCISSLLQLSSRAAIVQGWGLDLRSWAAVTQGPQQLTHTARPAGVKRSQ